jgi:hypothetical protein
MSALKNYLDTIRRLSLKNKQKDDMLGGTAAKLLKL